MRRLFPSSWLDAWWLWPLQRFCQTRRCRTVRCPSCNCSAQRSQIQAAAGHFRRRRRCVTLLLCRMAAHGDAGHSKHMLLQGFAREPSCFAIQEGAVKRSLRFRVRLSPPRQRFLSKNLLPEPLAQLHTQRSMLAEV